MSATHLQALLVRQQLVTVDQICQAVAYGHGAGATWLEQLLLWRAVDEKDVAHLASVVASVPLCDLDCLARLDYSVLGLVPADIAAEHRVVPVGYEPDGDLRLAMADPCNDTAIEELEFFTDRKILREVAPASAIAWALHQYYGIATPLWPATRARQAARPSQQLSVAA